MRDDFPMIKNKGLIYFDTAATAQKPQVVIDAISDFYKNHYGTVHRAVYELARESSERFQDVREKVARFLGAKSSNEIIFTRGTTESINMVAYSFGKAFIKPGDEVLLTEMEHHSNIVPWQILCEDRGAVLKVVPFKDNGELDLDAYQKLLSHRTKIVAVTHVSNTLGTINPIKRMITMAHEKGAKVLVDGAQAAPHMQVDVTDLDADFYVFSGHKIYGPTGIGILFGKEELLNQMPPYQGGGDMIEKVTFEKTTYNTLPLKFEAGTPMIAEVVGLGAAIDYLESLGFDKIQKIEHELYTYALSKIEKIPSLKVIGQAKEKGAILSFTVAQVHPLDLGTLLDLKGVAVRTGHHCNQPVMQHFGIVGTTRASFSFYNTKDEIDRFIELLIQAIGTLKC